MNPKSLSSNSTSFKTRFARRFLRALSKINKQKPASSSPKEDVSRRYRKVKIAAEASMACAAGFSRAWSRATIRKIRNQARRCALRRQVSINTIRKRSAVAKKRSKEFGFGQANELRKLVPGGEAMDLCSLLGETAHYIKCLTSQVQVMRRIANL